MLEGRKIAIKKFSDAVAVTDLRLEAEYHTVKGLAIQNFYFGKDVLEAEQYNSTYGLNAEAKGYPILRMHEFENIFTGTPSMHFNGLTVERYEELRLRKGDILICRTNGNPDLIGKSALVAKDYPYIYESHLFKVRVKENLISPTTTAIRSSVSSSLAA